jgi:hypothetical protein
LRGISAIGRDWAGGAIRGTRPGRYDGLIDAEQWIASG